MGTTIRKHLARVARNGNPVSTATSVTGRTYVRTPYSTSLSEQKSVADELVTDSSSSMRARQQGKMQDDLQTAERHTSSPASSSADVGGNARSNGALQPNERLAHDGDGASKAVFRRPPYSTDYSAAVDPVALVISECIAVTSAMRKHARWAHSSVSAILGGGASATRSQEATRSTDARGPSRSGLRSWSQDILKSTAQKPDGTGAINRWGLRGKKGRSIQDNPLIHAFLQLQSDLSRCTGRYGMN